MDANNVEYYSKLVRRRCEKALKLMKHRPERPPKLSKTIETRCLDRSPEKTRTNIKKVTSRESPVSFLRPDFEPKVVQNGI